MTIQRIRRERPTLPAGGVQAMVDRLVEDRGGRSAPDLRRELAAEFRSTWGSAPPPPWLSAVSDEAALGHRYVIGRPDPPHRVADPPLRLGWDLVRPWPWTDPQSSEHIPELCIDRLPAPERTPGWARALAWAVVALVIVRAWSRVSRRGALRLPS
jgi:hypothetical protein